MGTDAWIIGTGSTPFGRMPGLSHRNLAEQAVTDTLADAGIDDLRDLGGIWFGSCMMDYWGQAALRGQATLLRMLRDGRLPERTPVYNVEDACATGSLALMCAVREVAGGMSPVALAVGVDKLFDPSDRGRIIPWFRCGSAPFDLDELLAEYRRVSALTGIPFEPDPGRTLPMDTYSLQAQIYMQRFAVTREQFAAAAAKNRWHASMNPKAHHQSEISRENVLADRTACWPFSRSMCAPMSDGAAAAIVVSSDYLARCPDETRSRAVRVRAIGALGGKYRDVDEPSLTRDISARMYERAGVGPADIHLAEVHDATSFCELFQSEMLGFCGPGEGGAFVDSGASTLGGRLPINVSGGLVGKGHPIAATGLSMVGELTTQLRGEAGRRQVHGARIALHQNGGGVMGLEEALCVVSILEAPARAACRADT